MTFDNKIPFLCVQCGNVVRVPRAKGDPPDAVRLETSYCHLCDRGGNFEETWHFRRDGSECHPKDSFHE